MRIARLARTRVAVAALIGLGVALLTVPNVEAYPSTVCSVSVTPRHLVGGKTITATGTANEAIDWTFVLEASSGGNFTTQRATGHGTTFTHVFHTSKVSKATNLVLRSSCGGDTGVVIDPASSGTGGVGGNGNNGNSGGPSSSGGGGVLPNTGGPALWLALLAVALLGGGAYTLRRQRRRA